jgi:hypothetical protein
MKLNTDSWLTHHESLPFTGKTSVPGRRSSRKTGFRLHQRPIIGVGLPGTAFSGIIRPSQHPYPTLLRIGFCNCGGGCHVSLLSWFLPDRGFPRAQFGSRNRKQRETGMFCLIYHADEN